MLEYRRYRDAAGCSTRSSAASAGPSTARRRRRPSCAAPPSRPRSRPTSPTGSGSALGELLTPPPEPDTSHIRTHRLAPAAPRGRPRAAAQPQRPRLRRGLRPRGPLHPGVTLFALLELYRRGEATGARRRQLRPDRGEGEMSADGPGGDARGAALPLAGSGLGGGARRGDRGRGGRGRGRRRGARAASRQAAGASACAGSPAATRSRRCPRQRTPPAACWRSRARRR